MRAEWWVQAPEDQCVDRQVLAARLQEAVAEEVLASAPRRTVRVSLDQEVGRIDILVAREGVPLGERVVALEGASCDELVDAAVFVLVSLIEGGVGELRGTRQVLPMNEGGTQLAPPSAVEVEAAGGDAVLPDETPAARGEDPARASREASELVSPTPSVARPPENEPAMEPAEFARTGYLVGSLSVGVDYASGRVPLGFAPRLGLEIGRAGWRLRVAGVYRRGSQAVGDGDIAMDEVSGSARACYVVEVSAWTLGACGGLDVAGTWARGSGFDINRSASASSLGLGGDVAVDYRAGRFMIRAGVGAVGWLARGEFTFERAVVDVAYAQTPASVRGLLEVGVALGDPS